MPSAFTGKYVLPTFVTGTCLPFASVTVLDTGNPVTLTWILLVVPSVELTTVVLPPSAKFTVSYGFTKSKAVPFVCKFHPAFNTSDTVAALLPL